MITNLEFDTSFIQNPGKGALAVVPLKPGSLTLNQSSKRDLLRGQLLREGILVAIRALGCTDSARYQSGHCDKFDDISLTIRLFEMRSVTT